MSTPDDSPQRWWNAPTTPVDRATGAVVGVMSGATFGGLVALWLAPSAELGWLLALGAGAGALLLGAVGALAPKWITAMLLPVAIFERKQ